MENKFLQLTTQNGDELWLSHKIIESYRIQDKGRGSEITTEDGEKILVRESNRYITNELKRIGWIFL